MPTARPGVVYTAANDPNKLLGRPNGYLSKAAFADTRISDRVYPADSIELGGSVEVFANEQAARDRRDYIQDIAKKSPLGVEYDYTSGPVLLRVGKTLTPGQATDYKNALEAIN
jgi:hypothetical protein